jgi:hypothetical protein
MKENLWLTVVTYLSYCVDKELWKAIDYLKGQVRILKEQQETDKCILLIRHQSRAPTEGERVESRRGAVV